MKSWTRQVVYGNLVFQVFKNVYMPAEDTFLAADNMRVSYDDAVLDMGTGCGILAIIAAQKAQKVVAVDLNPYAVRCTIWNVKSNKLSNKIDVRRGDLFKAVHKNEKFNLIVFNPPYLPTIEDEQRSWLDKSWAGGPTGREQIDRFLQETTHFLKSGGRLLLVQSSLSDIEETLQQFRKLRFETKIVDEKKVAFERIVLIEASHLSEYSIMNC
jgi:release factor glutamine methyltransferase